LEASDPDGADNEYGDGDVITAIFSEDTNMVPVRAINTEISRVELDSLFDYVFDDGFENNPGELGTDYSAIWIDAKTLKITIIDSDQVGGLPLPEIDKFKVTIKLLDPDPDLDINLKDAAQDSLGSNSTSVLLSGTFGATTGPKLTFIEAADPDGTHIGSHEPPGFSDGDTITVNFLEETNRPNAAQKAEIDTMFSFTESGSAVSIGDDYIGAWKNSKVFVITILDAGDATLGIGTLTITATGTGIKILSKDGSSAPSTSTSLTLIGDFGLKEGPAISSLTANDPDGILVDELGGYNVGDTITVRFSEPTNLASFSLGITIDKAAVDSLFRFTQDIGDVYTAVWETDRKLVITIVDDTVDSPPEIDSLRLIVKESADLKDDDETSEASESVSPTLVGTFGEKEGPTILSLIAEDPLDLTPAYGNEDTITILFSETTNRASFTDDSLSKAEVDSIFEFSTSLGDDYIGRWITPAKFLITIKDSDNENPQFGSFSLLVKLSAGLKDESESSLVSTTSSPVLSGTFGSATPPTIFAVQASNSNTITISFNAPTNGPSSIGDLGKSSLDALFDYENNGVSASLGTSYEGKWITPFELQITILDPETSTPPIVGEFRFVVKDSTIQLLNAEETSAALTGPSPLLSGSFDLKSGPVILSITADDPDNSDDSYSIGDTITIEFSESTNTPFYDPSKIESDPRFIATLESETPAIRQEIVDLIDNELRALTKDEVDQLFIFTQELGDGYQGFWEDSSSFVITITDDEIDVPPNASAFTPPTANLELEKIVAVAFQRLTSICVIIVSAITSLPNNTPSGVVNSSIKSPSPFRS